MNIDAMTTNRDMRFYVEAAMAMTNNTSPEDPPSAIISSSSFSSMLENAIKMELLKDH